MKWNINNEIIMCNINDNIIIIIILIMYNVKY